MTALVNIVGVIGCGKSTLVNKVCAEYGFNPVLEPVEANPYLEDFYKNPKDFSYKMQYFLLGNRFKAHVDASRMALGEQKVSIIDLGFPWDISYANVNRDLGNINDLDYETYCNIVDWVMSPFVMPSTVNIYLKVDLDEVIRRIAERSRGCESGVPKDYLARLEVEHFKKLDELKSNKGIPYYVVDYSNYDSGYLEVVAILKLHGIIKGDK